MGWGEDDPWGRNGGEGEFMIGSDELDSYYFYLQLDIFRFIVSFKTKENLRMKRRKKK
jgi:hypothetical protein